MTTDFRALCTELSDALRNAIRVVYHEDGTQHISTAMPILRRARAALADEPASVAGQPSDEQLLDTLDRATADFPPRHPKAEGLNAVEYPLALELRKARAVLARWGNRQGSLDSSAPQPPAEGEVAELVAEIQHFLAGYQQIRGLDPEYIYAIHRGEKKEAYITVSRLTRAVELLQHLSPPQPVPGQEVSND